MQFLVYITLEDKLFRLGAYLIQIVMKQLRMFLSHFFFITNSYTIINDLKAVISVLSTDTFSSNEDILSSCNKISFSDICFSMILTSESVLQLNGDDLSEILG